MPAVNRATGVGPDLVRDTPNLMREAVPANERERDSEKTKRWMEFPCGFVSLRLTYGAAATPTL